VSTPVSVLDAVILGVVEGLTEFLPVSSTGHLTVAEGLLGLAVDDPAVTAFTAIIQFGAIVATFLYFRQDILRLSGAWVRGVSTDLGRFAGTIRGRHIAHTQHPADYRFGWAVILGSMPIGVVGLLGKDIISGPLRNLWVVAGALVLWSAVMYVSELRPTQKYGEEDLSIKQVLLIGIAQCVALVPGVSRSGATISGGLLLGATRVAATRLSFFLAIPALTGAGLVELKDIDTSVVSWGVLAVGTVVSFVVAYASIAWLLRLVAKYPITVFVPYRIIAGLALGGLLLSGTISPTG
jgi:undecaprenyl-diphosphatase